MEPTVLAKTIADNASLELQNKFIKGQQEHGGDFAVKPTVRNIREEALDLINYTHVLTQHRWEILVLIDDLLANWENIEVTDPPTALQLIRQKVHDL